MGSGGGSTMRNYIVCTVHLILRVIKSIILRWAGHVARMEEGRSAFKFQQVNLQERDLWGGLGVDVRNILEWTLKR